MPLTQDQENAIDYVRDYYDGGSPNAIAIRKVLEAYDAEREAQEFPESKKARSELLGEIDAERAAHQETQDQLARAYRERDDSIAKMHRDHQETQAKLERAEFQLAEADFGYGGWESIRARLTKERAETQALALELMEALEKVTCSLGQAVARSERQSFDGDGPCTWVDRWAIARELIVKAKGVLPALPPAESVVQPGTDTAAAQAQIPK